MYILVFSRLMEITCLMIGIIFFFYFFLDLEDQRTGVLEQAMDHLHVRYHTSICTFPLKVIFPTII